MRSQLQFFMCESDEDEFVKLGLILCDSLDKESNIQWLFKVGDCPIQFLRCRQFNNELISGRIALATSGFGLNYKSSEKAEQIYNKMRRWLKKYYTNSLTCRNLKIAGSVMKSREFWISSLVKEMIESTSELTLKQSKGANVIFELNKVA